MPRLTKLEEVLFPVAEHPVFVKVPGKDGVRHVQVPGKKAILNQQTSHVLGIVSGGYRLVSNQEALDMANLCCRTVFPETQPGEWSVNGVDAPATAGYCHIDLVHNSAALEFNSVPAEQRPDIFGPFIRVTNSFNGLRALGFNIGFYRKVCKNGLIIPDTIIRFKFTHQRRDIGETIQFKIAKDKLAEFRSAFTDSIASLKSFTLPRPQFDLLFRNVLAIHPPQDLQPQTRLSEDWHKLGSDIDEKCSRYAHELGDNAYAVFNAVTEFASRPPDNRCLHRDRHSYQRLAGSWLTSFTTECNQPGFSLAVHLDKLAKDRAKAKNQQN